MAPKSLQSLVENGNYGDFLRRDSINGLELAPRRRVATSRGISSLNWILLMQINYIGGFFLMIGSIP